MPLGIEVGLCPGHIVLDGDPAPPTAPPYIRPMPIVAKRSPISATAELLLLIYYKALTACTHFDISAASSSEYFYTWIITEKSRSTCHLCNILQHKYESGKIWKFFRKNWSEIF